MQLLFHKLNIAQTIYFNMKYFTFGTAIRLPVFIYRRTDLYKMNGQIIIQTTPSPGLVKIGPHGLGTQDIKYSRTMWEVDGTLIVNGKVCFGRGSRISIGNDAVLTVGDQFHISGRSSIICQKEISFGNNCLLSWDILIMDTDFHQITNSKGNTINQPRPIHIGNNVWIGCRNTILKGVTISDNVIVSAASTITQSTMEGNCAIGNTGKETKILKRDIGWRH